MSLITIFIILLAVVFATIAYVSEPSEAEKRTRERLAAIHRGGGESSDEDILKATHFSRIAIVDRLLRSNPIALKLQEMMQQANLAWTVGRFFFYSLVLMIAGAIIGKWSLPLGLAGWLLGMALGGVPLGWVAFKRSRRLRDLNMALPEAVDLMARGLRAGYALPSAIVMVADEMDEPLGPEFRRTAEELNFGLPFREALGNLAQRIPVTDFRFLVTAILVQKETGGNLIELFEKTASVLRSRIQLQRKIRVFTAQGRLTGAILVAMPFILFVLLNIIRPGYSTPLFENETGRKVVYGTLVSMGIGIVIIRRIINGIRV